jgi:hypothetical protein
MKTKAFSFTHRTKVIAGGTVQEEQHVTSGGADRSLRVAPE